MSDGREKRRYRRHPISCPVAVTRLSNLPDPSANMDFRALLVDISQGGLRLTSRELLQPNEKVRTVVTNDKTGVELNCTGVVRWSQRVTGGYVSGLQFTSVEKLSVPAAARESAERDNDAKTSGRQSSPEEPPASKDQS